MHIGYLTSEYPGVSKRFGGIATSVKNLAEAMVASGQQVTVFLYGCDLNDIYWQNGVRIVCIGTLHTKGMTWWFLRKKIEKIINTFVVTEQLDLVEAPDWTGITALMHLSCPLIIKLHGTDAYFCHIEGRKQKWKNYFFEKLALRSADAIISVSHYTAELTTKLFALKQNIKVIHNGIDTAKFESQVHHDTPNTLLYFGTLIRKKGVLELPYIFNEVIKVFPETRLLFIGGDSSDILTGSESTWELMKPLFTQQAFEKVEYLGKRPHDEIIKHIQNATLCVFPSYAEAFPVSWLEAMAASKAIVGSNMPWAYEVIEDGKSGYLVDPKKHELYATKIIKFLKDISLVSEFGENAKKRVIKNFSLEKIIDKHMQYYKDIVNKNKGKGV